MGIRDIILTLCPTWLRNESPVTPSNPDGGVGGRYMYNIGLAMDGLLDKTTQAMYAWMPTRATPTSLSYIGNDRLMPRGLYQTDAQYGAQLQGSLDVWQTAGTLWSLLREALAYVSPATGPYPYACIQVPYYRLGWEVGPGLPGYYSVVGSPGNGACYYDSYTHGYSTDGYVNYNYPSSNPNQAPSSYTPQFDWDSLSQQETIGYLNADFHRYTADGPGLTNYWRWFLILSQTFNQNTVTSATNATPIVVTTATPHGYTTGQTVSVGGVNGYLGSGILSNSNGLILVTLSSAHGLSTGASISMDANIPNDGPGTSVFGTAAEGNWVITVTGSDTFTLNGSIFDSTVPTTPNNVFLYSILPEASWVITVTSPTTFSLNSSVAAGVFFPTTFSRVYTVASNTWFDKAPVFGASGFLIGDQTVSIGINLPASDISTLRNIMKLWKVGQSFLDTMIFSLSPTLFNGVTSGSVQGAVGSTPDGRFGRWSRINSTSTGGFEYVPSRFANARYCEGVQ